MWVVRGIRGRKEESQGEAGTGRRDQEGREEKTEETAERGSGGGKATGREASGPSVIAEEEQVVEEAGIVLRVAGVYRLRGYGVIG